MKNTNRNLVVGLLLLLQASPALAGDTVTTLVARANLLRAEALGASAPRLSFTRPGVPAYIYQMNVPQVRTFTVTARVTPERGSTSYRLLSNMAVEARIGYFSRTRAAYSAPQQMDARPKQSVTVKWEYELPASAQPIGNQEIAVSTWSDPISVRWLALAREASTKDNEQRRPVEDRLAPAPLLRVLASLQAEAAAARVFQGLALSLGSTDTKWQNAFDSRNGDKSLALSLGEALRQFQSLDSAAVQATPALATAQN